MRKLYNKEVLAQHSYNLETLGFTTVYVTESKQDGYYDIHIEDDMFKREELNTLDQQIPKENFKDEYLSEEWAHKQAIAKMLWARYSTHDKIKFYWVECEVSE